MANNIRIILTYNFAQIEVEEDEEEVFEANNILYSFFEVAVV